MFALTLFIFPVVALASGRISQSCSNLSVSGPHESELAGDCRKNDGTIGFTEIDLNNCLANDRGDLYCSRGNYGLSCASCLLSGTIFRCLCANVQGAYTSTSFDLDACIGNNNGDFVC
ncbi:Cyanovirin-N [Gyrodon lividus]|nr:Cyanovirin-N [Gyrodon lividus]